MNGVDALLFSLLALADIALIVHLRRRRTRQMRLARMYRSLKVAVRRETETRVAKAPVREERRVFTFRRNVATAVR